MATPRDLRRGGRISRRDLGRRREQAPGCDATGTLATEDDHGVAVTASTTENLNNIAAAAGRVFEGVGIGLDILVNIVTDNTHAKIDGARQGQRGRLQVIVRAHQETEDSNSGGSGAVGTSRAAPGSTWTSSRTTPRRCIAPSTAAQWSTAEQRRRGQCPEPDERHDNGGRGGDRAVRGRRRLRLGGQLRFDDRGGHRQRRGHRQQWPDRRRRQ